MKLQSEGGSMWFLKKMKSTYVNNTCVIKVIDLVTFVHVLNKCVYISL